MRVVLFAGGGPLSLAALSALRDKAEIVAVVVPREPIGSSSRAWLRTLARRWARRPLVRAARRLPAPIVWSGRGGEADLEVAVRAREPDLFVVASFPRLLPPSLLAVPRLGSIGLHASLLPRHRGPMPLFWTYVQDDREAGISLFWLEGGEDSGPVLASMSMTLPRGLPVDELYPVLAEKGGTLLSDALPEIEAGTAERWAQDPEQATREPSPSSSGCIDFEAWSAERVWHVLSGLGARHSFLVDDDGRPLSHGRASGFRLESHGRRVGSVVQLPGGWRLYCRDGVVDVARGPWWRASLAWLRRRCRERGAAR